MIPWFAGKMGLITTCPSYCLASQKWIVPANVDDSLPDNLSSNSLVYAGFRGPVPDGDLLNHLKPTGIDDRHHVSLAD